MSFLISLLLILNINDLTAASSHGVGTYLGQLFYSLKLGFFLLFRNYYLLTSLTTKSIHFINLFSINTQTKGLFSFLLWRNFKLYKTFLRFRWGIVCFLFFNYFLLQKFLNFRILVCFWCIDKIKIKCFVSFILISQSRGNWTYLLILIILLFILNLNISKIFILLIFSFVFKISLFLSLILLWAWRLLYVLYVFLCMDFHWWILGSIFLLIDFPQRFGNRKTDLNFIFFFSFSI